jgi:hypothetical protein
MAGQRNGSFCGSSQEIEIEPFLSVVMPTYNGEKFIAAALESATESMQGHKEALPGNTANRYDKSNPR